MQEVREMYDADFFSRIGIQQICEFFRHGDEWDPTEPGTLEERFQRHDQGFLKALETYRDEILKTAWAELSQPEKEGVTESLYGPILDEAFALEAIHFEAGFRAGVLLTKPCRGSCPYRGRGSKQKALPKP